VSSVKSKFKVGDVVVVIRRTDCGSNKPGGTARVAAITKTELGFQYTVKYIVQGGRESELPELYLSFNCDEPPTTTASAREARDLSLKLQVSKLENKRSRVELKHANSMMRDAVVEATDFKRAAAELQSRAETAERLFQSEEEKASLEKRMRLQENAEAETFKATAGKKLKQACVQAQKEAKKANIAREKERWGYEARIAQAHMRVVEIASEVHENTEERVAEATNELVLKLKKCELASKRVCASHVVEMNALKSKHEAQSANLLRFTREEQELAKSKQKEETQLLKSGHDAAVQGLEREHAHEVQS
jgi:hypothetical protein